MSRLHRWHQKKRKARRAQHLHNWLTMAQTSHEPDPFPHPDLPLVPHCATRIK